MPSYSGAGRVFRRGSLGLHANLYSRGSLTATHERGPELRLSALGMHKVFSGTLMD